MATLHQHRASRSLRRRVGAHHAIPHRRAQRRQERFIPCTYLPTVQVSAGLQKHYTLAVERLQGSKIASLAAHWSNDTLFTCLHRLRCALVHFVGCCTVDSAAFVIMPKLSGIASLLTPAGAAERVSASTAGSFASIHCLNNAGRVPGEPAIVQHLVMSCLLIYKKQDNSRTLGQPSCRKCTC